MGHQSSPQNRTRTTPLANWAYLIRCKNGLASELFHTHNT